MGRLCRIVSSLLYKQGQPFHIWHGCTVRELLVECEGANAALQPALYGLSESDMGRRIAIGAAPCREVA